MIDDYVTRAADEKDLDWCRELVSQKNVYYTGGLDDNAQTYIVENKNTKERLGFYQIAHVFYIESLFIDQRFTWIKKAGVFIFICRFLKELFDSKKMKAIWIAKINKDIAPEKGIYAMYKRLGTKVNHRKFHIFKNF